MQSATRILQILVAELGRQWTHHTSNSDAGVERSKTGRARETSGKGNFLFASMLHATESEPTNLKPWSHPHYAHIDVSSVVRPVGYLLTYMPHSSRLVIVSAVFGPFARRAGCPIRCCVTMNRLTRSIVRPKITLRHCGGCSRRNEPNWGVPKLETKSTRNNYRNVTKFSYAIFEQRRIELIWNIHKSDWRRNETRRVDINWDKLEVSYFNAATKRAKPKHAENMTETRRNLSFERIVSVKFVSHTGRTVTISFSYETHALSWLCVTKLDTLWDFHLWSIRRRSSRFETIVYPWTQRRTCAGRSIMRLALCTLVENRLRSD